MNSFIHRAKLIFKKQLLTLALACAMLISAAPLQAMALDEQTAELPVTANNVINGGFESGDLTGWTVLTEGFDASSAVVSERTYWEQELPYNQSGSYHLNGWNTGIPEEEGWAVRSSTFVLGGSGYISVKMGGNAAVTKVFLSDGTQVGYYRNFRFHDVNFPYISKGGAWCDMATYVIDLSDYLGREMYVELHDEVITDGWAQAFFDDVVTYYETAPDASRHSDKAPDGHNPGEMPKLTYIPWVSVPRTSTEYANQIPNGDFETGDLSGWTVFGSGFPIKNGLPAADSASTYWDQELPFNKSGNYFINGSALSSNEANTWRLRSTPFTLSGSGWISVKMGGHAAAVRVYKLDGTLVGDFDQSRFCDKNFPYLSKDGSWNDMATYLLDLTQNIGDVLYIELCDDPIAGGWANAFFDDVVTYYEKAPAADKYDTVNDGHQPGEKAKTVKIPTVVGMNNLYSPRNGGFELGNLTGWTVICDYFKPDTAVVSAATYGLNEERHQLPYNQSGNFHLSGRDAVWEESDTWAVRSSPFTMAGSGYISVKMGGSSASFRVRTVEDNKLIAYCDQRRYNDVNFPYIAKGGSWWDMAVYVMDLSDYLGEKLVIELVDEEVDAGWAHAFFDDVIAYYPQRPTTKADTVYDGYDAWNEEPEEIEIPWIYLDEFEDFRGQWPTSAELTGFTANVAPGQTGTITKPDGTTEGFSYQTVNLYDCFSANQGPAFQLDEGKLKITKVTYYDNDGKSTSIIADYSKLNAKEGCYVVEYKFEQVGQTQTGSFSVLVQPENVNTIFNGGFECGNLAGWTVVEGNGFNTSTAVISAENYWPDKGNMPYNQEGSYHLDGWNTGIGEGGTWTVRSSTFTLDQAGSGWISWRMGGKAAAVKVYTADDNKLVGYYKQTRFADKDFPNVPAGSWADMGTYVADLSEHSGKKLYIELCADAVNGSWGLAFFDDVKTDYATKPDWKNKDDSCGGGWRMAINQLGQSKPETETAPAGAQITNGGFETGDLTGWTPIGFDAGDNNNRGIVSAQTYWNQKLPYNQAGDFHLDGWATDVPEQLSWTVRSETFTLQGSGYISVRMGGKAAAVKVYKADGELVGYYKQNRFNDASYPNVSAGGSWADMGTYVMDLHEYVNEKLYIELCDEIVDGGWAHAFFDEVVTYYENAPDCSGVVDYVVNGKGGNGAVPEVIGISWQEADNKVDEIMPPPDTITNGGFETSDLTGWTVIEGNFGNEAVISAQTYWTENLPYNQAGNFHLNGVDDCGIHSGVETWGVRSSTFTLSGSGFISVRMGGHAAAVKVYKANGEMVGYYRQNRFNNDKFPSVGAGGSWADMATYVMDLHKYIGEELYIVLCDEKAAGDWVIATFDEVVTCYETALAWENQYDTVRDGGNNAGDVNIPWQLTWEDGPRPAIPVVQLDEIEILEEETDALEAPANEETHEGTHEEIPDDIPEEPSKVTPGETPEEPPEITPEETPEGPPEITPEETPEGPPEVTPGETPEEPLGVMPEVIPEETSDETPEESPEETPDTGDETTDSEQ